MISLGAEDGTIKFCLPLDPHLRMQWCDECHDYGAVTAGAYFAFLLVASTQALLLAVRLASYTQGGH